MDPGGGFRLDGPHRRVRIGARVIEANWRGYAGQKNRLDQAAHEWFSIDADEALSEPGVRSEAQKWRIATLHRAAPCPVPRQVDPLLRLVSGSQNPSFDRGKARWVGEYVHESVVSEGRVGELEGNLLHYTCGSLSEHLKTMDRYTTLAAEEVVAHKKHVGYRQLLLDPPWAFCKTYIVQRGFLDGAEGLTIAYMAAFYTFLKYAKARYMLWGR